MVTDHQPIFFDIVLGLFFDIVLGLRKLHMPRSHYILNVSHFSNYDFL